MIMHRILFTVICTLASLSLWAQGNTNQNKFRQLGTELPTPNTYRTASGSPGHEYWQQKADYKINLTLDDAKQTITGSETITYTNNSPDDLKYLWLQLDQNVRAQNSMRQRVRQQSMKQNMGPYDMKGLHNDFDGGFKLTAVTDASGRKLDYTVVETMMRIDLPKTLKSGSSYSFSIKWWYNINDRMKIGGRSGLEYFKDEDNYLYTIAQFYPRMCVYIDNEGWQNKQFLGNGEFTLSFGDYDVSITVPSDHIVGATGELQNAKTVLTSTQRKRFEKARTAKEPVMIVTQEEAEKAEKNKAKGTKTWQFKAKNVRDFAFASSRKFIWDAMGTKVGDRTVMSMSYYPKEGNPLWERYSTKVVDHTVKTYSKYTVDYPYPVAISVHANRIGMEYPMICFNGGRPEPDGTYDSGTKHGMISVIVHEVGHNFFPMIINSDERQWTWMDEGLNTFVQFLTEQEWDREYPSRRGPAHKITNYMAGDKSMITPIMTNSESLFQFGNNAYAKPATALNILRETILGRELFDFAFKEYCTRWALKHPTPADFFRSMEDASGVDLDWFWRGWFYTTDHCDQAIASFKWYQINTQNPEIEKAFAKEQQSKADKGISELRNDEEINTTKVEADEELRDFYITHDPFEVYQVDIVDFENYYKNLDPEMATIIDENYNYYEISIASEGGLVMPVIIKFEYTDGTSEDIYLPAEIWKAGDEVVTKVFPRKKEVLSVSLDPYLEIADVDRSDNYYPPRLAPSRFQIYKSRSNGKEENPMQRMQRNQELIKE